MMAVLKYGFFVLCSLAMCVIALTLSIVLSRAAEAACAQQTLTISMTTAGGTLSSTACISNADITQLRAALDGPLIASGIPSPTGAQEWTAALNLMVGALNAFGLQYATNQSVAAAPAVTFSGAH
jgi:hypothetical protein